MNELLTLAVGAHGGLSRWNRFPTLTAMVSITGALWRFKSTADLLTQVSVEALLHEQRVTTHLVGRSKRLLFTPQRVASETEDGRLLEARDDPRSAFSGHRPETAWDDLHVAYFNSYALWTYLTIPFLYTNPGFVTEELPPPENASVRRSRLALEFDRIRRGPLDNCRLAAYACNMNAKEKSPVAAPCLCNALRQASRAVSRLYDEELRSIGLRTTQYSLLQLLRRSGEVRQRDLGELTLHDQTTLTRNLRPLVDAGWVAVRTGEDRREKWLKITASGVAKLEEARPAWQRAQERMQSLLSEGVWQNLLDILPDVAQKTAGA